VYLKFESINLDPDVCLPVNVGCPWPQFKRILLASSVFDFSSLLDSIIPTTNWCLDLINGFSSDNLLCVAFQTIFPSRIVVFLGRRLCALLRAACTRFIFLAAESFHLSQLRERVSDEPPGLAKPPSGPPEI
jgi:hypothetical protein